MTINNEKAYIISAVKAPKMCNLICARKVQHMYRRLIEILIKNNLKYIEQSFNSVLVTSTENSITTHKSICEQMVL